MARRPWETNARPEPPNANRREIPALHFRPAAGPWARGGAREGGAAPLARTQRRTYAILRARARTATHSGPKRRFSHRKLI